MRWIVLTLVALAGAVAAAFTIQNSTFTVPLQLDLGVAAWRLSKPASVSALMWSAFGIGALLPALVLGVRSVRLASRVKALEQEIALGSARSPAKDPWAGA